MYVSTFSLILEALNDIKVRVFFGKNIEKKLLYRHNKNYYYFCKVSKNMLL